MDIPHSLFEEKLEKLKYSKGVKLDTDLTANDLKLLVEQYKNVYLEAKGEKFPSGSKYMLSTSSYFVVIHMVSNCGHSHLNITNFDIVTKCGQMGPMRLRCH